MVSKKVAQMYFNLEWVVLKVLTMKMSAVQYRWR